MMVNLDGPYVHYCGDCRDLLREIPDNSIRLIISSPPYNIGKAYETKKRLDDYAQEQATIIRELHRVCAPNGSICWQVGNYVDGGQIVPLDYVFYPIFEALGMKMRNRIVWKFGSGLHASKRLSGRYETILWFTKGDSYVFNLDAIRVPSKYPGKRSYQGAKKGQPSGNPLGKNPSDVWDIIPFDGEEGVWDIPNVKQNHCEKTSHPCQFPIEIVERCVLALTNRGDKVLDPYSGVASSIIGALKHERIGIGSEMDPNYFKIGEERIRSFQAGTLKTRPLGQPVFTPSGKVSQVPEEWK